MVKEEMDVDQLHNRTSSPNRISDYPEKLSYVIG
jgi:hypothetical protein